MFSRSFCRFSHPLRERNANGLCTVQCVRVHIELFLRSFVHSIDVEYIMTICVLENKFGVASLPLFFFSFFFWQMLMQT